MPFMILGPINFASNEGNVITGHAYNVSPTSTSKVATGSGSFNTGNVVISNNGANSVNTPDPDVVDSAIEEQI